MSGNTKWGRQSKLFAPILLISLLILVFLPACTSEWTVFVGLSTTCIIDINGKNSKKISNDIKSLILDFEALISTSDENSEVYKLNHAKAGTAVSMSSDTIALFELSLQLNNISEAFNPAIFPLVELWGFSPLTYTGISPEMIPDKSQIKQILPICSLSNFVLDKEKATITKLDSKAMLDFGAIAKGYIANKVESVAKDTKYTINLGGDIFTNTQKEIYVQSPFATGFSAKVSLNNEAIATCGSYQRNYEFEGKQYHHVIDKTGYPSGLADPNPIVSVSVISKSGAYADAIATIIMIEGEAVYENLSQMLFSALIIRQNGDFKILGENRFEIIS